MVSELRRGYRIRDRVVRPSLVKVSRRPELPSAAPHSEPLGRSPLAVKRDYYEVLGVGRQASADDLKRAFRKIAMDSHPDRNPDDAAAAARFKEASEAYTVLSDPGRRRSYDMFGHAAGDFGGGPAVDFSDMPFGDLFETFFGGGMGGRARRERANRGDDLRYDITITFEEAFTGVDRQIEVPRLVTCERCTGSGAEPGTGVETCGTCSGSGQVRRAQQSIFGSVVTAIDVPHVRQAQAACSRARAPSAAARAGWSAPGGLRSGSRRGSTQAPRSASRARARPASAEASPATSTWC